MSSERDRFYANVFITALEGGIGYWSFCDEYHWEKKTGTPPEGEFLNIDYDGYFAVVTEFEEGDKAPQLRIDRSTIAKGWNLLLLRPDWAGEAAREANKELDAGQVDANLADMVVQLGLFRDVIYG